MKRSSSSLTWLWAAAIAVAAIAPLAHAAEFVPPRASAVVCGARAPAPGRSFSGPVLHVFDGQTFCVAEGPTPSEWVRVRLADHSKDAGRRTLLVAAFAKRVVCFARRPDRAGVVPRCTLEGVPLSKVMKEPSVLAEAPLWR
jgi:hypothetical protein